MFQSKASLKFKKRANLWSNSTGTNTFDPENCRAYSWCYVAKIKGKVVFKNYTYSNTTTGHQSATRALLREMGIKIDVFVNVRAGLQSFEHESLRPVYERIFLLELTNARKGIRQATKEANVEHIKELKAVIAKLMVLGAKFSKADQIKLKAQIVESENQRLERARKERKERPQRSSEKLIKESNTFKLVI